MSKINSVLKIMIGVVFSGVATANAATSDCSIPYLVHSIGHDATDIVSCVDVSGAQSQFEKDFLPAKIESAALYNRYQQESSVAGLSGDATAPLVVRAINEQVNAMYNVAAKEKDFIQYMGKIQAYYGAAHCIATLNDGGKSLVVSCPEKGKFPSFKDVYHVSPSGSNFTFNSVSFGQIEVLRAALGAFQAKLEKLYVPKKENV